MKIKNYLDGDLDENLSKVFDELKLASDIKEVNELLLAIEKIIEECKMRVNNYLTYKKCQK